MTIYEAIESLCAYGVQVGLTDAQDVMYSRNQLSEIFNLTDWERSDIKSDNHFDLLKVMVEYAYDHNIIESNKPPYSDLFESKVMNVLLPKPSEVIRKYQEQYRLSAKNATDYFYEFSKKSHYIRLDRTSKNMMWTVNSKYGEVDITVNLSKPEKDPKAIAAALLQTENNYPKCFLCKENEGYSGHLNHPGRHNHRIMPLTLNGESWYFQYSPYAYFNEHSIVFKSEHTPMCINRETFKRLFEFVDKMPHYFIGSNADLPLVGGSMLTHDHYQSGDYEFAMDKTTTLKTYDIKGVKADHLNWPLSVIRLSDQNLEKILEVSETIFEAWKHYDDERLNIVSHTGKTRHNTVTPIVRKVNNSYQIDLVLRNNRMDDEHPTGIFHPSPEVHPVKKENIGLIEVMGLAVLPSRLKDEMKEMVTCLEAATVLPEHLTKFQTIVDQVDVSKPIHNQIKTLVGLTFVKGLEDAGVYKLTEQGIEGFEKFIQSI